MKTTLLLIPLFLAFAASAAEQPVETDPRLHSDGKGWKLNQATIKDPKRPRVLLIGDSILSGYMNSAIKALEGKAYVDAWVNPYNQSEHLNNKILPEVLAKGPYDVIHFNMGLHGWPEGRIKPGTFEPLTKGYVEVIKAKLPKARIIWASSTPVLLEGEVRKLDPVINANILEQNRMAAKVMAEMNVPVNDFYSVLVDKLELARGGKDKFHWTPPAYKLLSDACVQSVLGALGMSASYRHDARDLILVAGQSNAVGYDAYASELPPDAGDKDVLFWWRVGDPPPDEFDVASGGKWTHLQAQPKGRPMETRTAEEKKQSPRQYGNFGKPEGGFGPETGFARELRAKEGRPLALVKVAFSGTAMMMDWNPDDPGIGGSCYRTLVTETKTAIAAAAAQGITLRLRALVWVQGESDATPAAAPRYERNLAHMLTRLRADLDAAELVALIGVNTRFGNGRNPNMPVVIAQQRALAAKDPLSVYVDTEGAETLPPSHTHFTARGTLEIGRRYAAALLAFEERR